MARKKSRPKATSRKQRAHSPSRRKALKGIAAYIGDKAVGGVIGNAAAVALGAVMGQLTASGKMPSPAPELPIITHITPATARPGEIITIFGRGFAATPGKVIFTRVDDGVSVEAVVV
jgi:hypothetical protein